MKRPSVLVVGAGPAGAACAILLARAGARVRLIDRQHFPRFKPCGDCLSPGVAPLLAELGVLEEVRTARPAILTGWRLVAPSGAEARARFPATLPPALALPRDRLDTVLVHRALAEGAALEQASVKGVGYGHGGVPQIFLTDGRALTADFVVGADGLRSVVARRLGAIGRASRIRKLSLSAHVNGVADLEPWGEMHLAAHACAGLAPLEDGADPVCNLTLVLDRRAGPPPRRPDPAAFLRLLDDFPGLRGRLARIRFRAHDHRGPLLASGPFDRPVRHLTRPGFALVGDAAGYFDPFTGQGIYQAIAGARLLVRELLDGFTPRRDLTGYARAARRLVREVRLLQHVIERVVARPGSAELAVAALVRSPAFARTLLAATGDMTPPRRLLSPRLLSTFLAPPGPQEAAS
jgi:menaquinone-9 beta-reductase